jgi:hypothetical protein
LAIIRTNPLISLFIALALFTLGILISDIPTMVVSSGWPTTRGEVVSNRLVGQKFKEYDGDYYLNVDAFIRYEYTVDGFSFSSLSINSINTPFYPREVVVRYPVGTEVTVYYNPKDPSEAVLEPGFVNLFKALDIFSYLSFAVGAYFLHLAASRIKQICQRNRNIT